MNREAITFFTFWITSPMIIAFAIVMRLDKALQGKALWYPVALLIGLPFFLLDVLYNWIIGSIIWGELPKELTYTSRLKRMKARGEEEAFRQCRILNKYDPDHC